MCCCQWSREKITESSQRTLLNEWSFSPCCSGEDGSAVSVHASKAFSQWEAPWSCPCISDFKEAVQYRDNRALPSLVDVFFSCFKHPECMKFVERLCYRVWARRCKAPVCTCSLSFVCAEQHLPTPDVKQKENTHLLVERRRREEKGGWTTFQGTFPVNFSSAVVSRTAAVAAPAEGRSEFE